MAVAMVVDVDVDMAAAVVMVLDANVDVLPTIKVQIDNGDPMIPWPLARVGTQVVLVKSMPSVIGTAMKVHRKMVVAIRLHPMIIIGKRDKEMEGVGAKVIMEGVNLTRPTVYGAVLVMITLMMVVAGLKLILLFGLVKLARVGVRTVLQAKAMLMNPLMIVAGDADGDGDEDKVEDEDREGEGEGDGAKLMVKEMDMNMNVITTAIVVDGAMLELKVTILMVVVGLMQSLLVGKII